LKRAGILTVCFLILALPACEDEVICTQELVSRTGAGFYVRDIAGQRDTVLRDMSFYALARPDSLLHYPASPARSIKFPLPQEPEEYTAFVMETGTGTDTIRIYHDTKLVLVSYSCGYAAVHVLEKLEYGHRVIDTIAIDDPLVDLTDDENLKIYVRPAVADTAVSDTAAAAAAGMFGDGSAF
jgi:hypothetical protein